VADQDEKLQESPFDTLRDFITGRMQMSHIYQPLMLKTLLEYEGTASVRQIAQAFLARDESQIEYYEEITKRWPTRVLSQHGLVKRSGPTYQLAVDPNLLTGAQKEALIRLCDQAISNYEEKRGRRIWEHRNAALGDVPGSIRYEVLKRSSAACPQMSAPWKSTTSCRANMAGPTIRRICKRSVGSAMLKSGQVTPPISTRYERATRIGSGTAHFAP
jgi:hypothetical protein